ncbi:MAG: tetratricopeptide repeat protein [Bradymonadaceae bacterium]
MNSDFHQLVEEVDDRLFEGSFDRARTAIEEARREAGDHPRLDALEAEIEVEAGRMERALRAVEAGLDRLGGEGDDELRAEFWALRGDALFYTDRDEEAREAFNRAVRLDGWLWPAIVGRATVHEHLGYLRAAKLDLDRALEIDPAAAEPRALRGRIHLYEGDLEAAESDFDRALEVDPDDVESRLQLARLRADEAARSEAIELLGPLLDGEPVEDPAVGLPAALLRSQLRVDLGDHDGARADARRAIEIAGEQPWGYLQLAAARIAAGEPGDAIAALKRADERIDRPRRVPDLSALRASAYRHLGKVEKAEQLQRRVEGVARLPEIVYGEALNPAEDVPIDPDKPFDVQRLLEQLFGDPEAAPDGYEQKLRELLDRVPELVDEHPDAGEIEIELPPIEEGGPSPGHLQLQVRHE